MDINAMVGLVRAAVVTPDDTVVITVDRILTSAQLDEISLHMGKRLPGVRVVTLGKGMTIQVLKVEGAPVSA